MKRVLLFVALVVATGTLIVTRAVTLRATGYGLRANVAPPPGMVFVPGGEFWMGTDDADADLDAKPRRRVRVGPFFIRRHEVTNAEYRRFRPSHRFPKRHEHYPVTGVLWDEANAYARWAGGSLPTEAEWEKAARGTDGRRYPWGDVFDAKRANVRGGTTTDHRPPATSRMGKTGEGNRATPSCRIDIGRRGLRPVGSYLAGASPYGVLDMAGNAWEWVEGFYEGDPERRIIRGGAHGYFERHARTYARGIEGAGVT